VGDYNRDRRDRGRGGRGDYQRRDGGRGDGGRREMFDAVCDECGKECKVPFKPTSNKPIYCSECFENVDQGDSRGSRDSRSFSGGRDRDRAPRRDFKDDRSGDNKAVAESLSRIDSTLNKILDFMERNSAVRIVKDEKKIVVAKESDEKKAVKAEAKPKAKSAKKPTQKKKA